MGENKIDVPEKSEPRDKSVSPLSVSLFYLSRNIIAFICTQYEHEHVVSAESHTDCRRSYQVSMLRVAIIDRLINPRRRTTPSYESRIITRSCI